jgi:hypothetical protein
MSSAGIRLPKSKEREDAETVETPVYIIGNSNKHFLVETALEETPGNLTMPMGRISNSLYQLKIVIFKNLISIFSNVFRIHDGTTLALELRFRY